MKCYTDIEQSKQLSKILSIGSADMHYVRKAYDFMGNPVDGEWSHPKYGNPNSKYANYIVQNFESYEKIPCWSLVALLDVLQVVDNNIEFWSDNEGWHLSNAIYEICTSNPVDTCVEMIIKLKEENLL